jgi:ABC-type transporter Mla MlaB component
MSFGPSRSLSCALEQTVFTVYGPLARDDLPGLCDRACSLLAVGAGDFVCEVGRDVAADAVAVDALARLELAARRRGCHIRLRGVSSELRRLLELCGLEDVPPFRTGLGIEPGREAEEREEARGVEEERQLGDAAV